MADDIFKPTPVVASRVSLPNQLVWEFVRADHRWFRCELHFKGESWGWLAQIYLDGTPLGGQRFMLRAHAMQWAEEERQSLQDEPK